MGSLNLPRITGIITRSGSVKMRYKFDRATGNFHNTRNRSVAGTLINGKLCVFSGGLSYQEKRIKESEDLVQAAFEIMAQENPEVYKAVSQYLIFRPAANITLLHYAIKCQEYYSNPLIYFNCNLHPIMGLFADANRSFALEENIDRMDEVGLFLLGAAERAWHISEEHKDWKFKLHPWVFFTWMITPMVEQFGPALLKIENFEVFKYFVNLSIDRFDGAGTNEPMFFLKIVIDHMLRQFPEIAKAENLEETKELMALADRAFPEHPRSYNWASMVVNFTNYSEIQSHSHAMRRFLITQMFKYAESGICPYDFLGFYSIFFKYNPSFKKSADMAQLEQFGEYFRHTLERAKDLGISGSGYGTSLIQQLIEDFLLKKRPLLAIIDHIVDLKKHTDMILDLLYTAKEHGIDPYILGSCLLEHKNASISFAETMSVATQLVRLKILPFPVLIDAINHKIITIEELATRYERISKQTLSIETLMIIDFTDPINNALLSSHLKIHFTPDDFGDYHNQYADIILKCAQWIKDNPGFAKIDNPLKPFTVSGKGEVDIRESYFDNSLIDNHAMLLLEEVAKTTGLLFGNTPLSFEDNIWFATRVLAQLQLRKALREGRLPGNFVINNTKLREHIHRHPEVFSRALPELLKDIATFDHGELSVSLYIVCIGALIEAKRRNEGAKADHLRQMISHALFSEGINDPQLLNAIINRSSTAKAKLEALQQIYQDRITHVAERAAVQIPDEVRTVINQRMDELKKEYEKIGIAQKLANVQEYAVVPAETSSLLRGFFGKDCTKNGNYPLWAFNPNHFYLLIKKGVNIKGYIGLTKCRTPDGKKIILVDTMQPCPPGIVESILRTIDKMAKSLGYEGIAVSDNLAEFNYDETREAVSGLSSFKRGGKTKLRPEDEKSWAYFTKKLGSDQHSLEHEYTFVILRFDS